MMERNPTAEPEPSSQTGASSFALVLRTLRAAAELTQEELAERSGVSVRAISDLERGAKTRPQRATVDLLARGLGLDATQRAALEGAVPSRHRTADRLAHTLDLPVGGFLGSVPDRPLVARVAETERVRALVETVKGGAGRLLLLTGEPGVGKTRLAQEATLISRASGLYLAAGQCYEPQQAVAFYPFLEVLRRLIPAARARLGVDPLQRWPQLGPLLPEDPHTAVRPGAALAGAGDQQRLFWAVAALFEALAATTPVIVALDDLHWADQSSLALLHRLARHSRQSSVLLLGTYRDADVGPKHPLRGMLRDLHREHLVEEIALDRLDRAGTEALMVSVLGKGPVAPGFVDLVHGRTDGNAFFAQEIVRMLVERGDAFLRDSMWECDAGEDIAIPRTVYEAIGERLSRLTGDTQVLLGEASVLGHSFEFDDLSAMGDRSEVEIEAGLEEARRASVLRFGEHDSYSFYHALTQQVLYRELAPRRRRRLHLAAGGAIEQQPERIREQRAAELAWHFLEGGARDKAITYAVLAGDQAESRFAHQEAVQHYRSVVKLAGEDQNVNVEAAILEKLGRVLTNFGRYEDARHALEQAGPLFRQTGDRAGEARVTVQLGSVYRATRRAEAAIDRVEAVLGRIEVDGRLQDIAELCIALETLFFSTGRYLDGLRAAVRAVEIARELGDVQALARAETGLGTELIVLGRLDEGLAVLEDVIARPGASDDPFNLVRALGNAADGYRYRGKLIRSQQIAEQSMEVGERVQSPWDTAIALACAGAACRLLGEWARARGYLERGDNLRRSLPPAWWSIYVIEEFGALCLDEGHWEKASELLNDGHSIARRAKHLEGIRFVERLLAELDLLEGRPEAARRRLEPLLDRPGLEELQVTEILPTLSAAYAASGDLIQAERTVEEAIRRATAANGLLALGSALVMRGRLRATRARRDDASSDFAEAVRLAREMPYPHLEGRALFEWGALLADQGEHEQARERLNAALSIFERLGARPYVDRTMRMLEELA